MNTGPPRPPTIPDSSVFTTNQNSIMSSNILYTPVLTDGIATMGPRQQLQNLKRPVNYGDAANVDYANQTTYSVGPANNVQFNDDSVFGSSTNLTFDGLTLTINGLYTDNFFQMSGSTINNLKSPVNSLDLATKKYVDSFDRKLVQTQITSDISNLYEAAFMVNGLIIRNTTTTTTTPTTITDTTDIAYNLIKKMSGTLVGSFCRFYLLNNSTGTTFTMNAGLGVSILTSSGSISVRPNYVLSCRLIITGFYSVSIVIDSVSWSMAYMSPLFLKEQTGPLNEYSADVSVSSASLSGLQTIGSVALNTGSIVLVTNQGHTSGLYIASSGSWTPYFTTGQNIYNSNVYVTSSMTCSSNIFYSEPYTDPLTVGTDSITFVSTTDQTTDQFMTVSPYSVENVLLGPVVPNTANTQLNYTYTEADINAGFIVRDPPSASTDVIDYSNFSQFIIQNLSGFQISITSDSMTLDPTSIIIKETHSGLLWSVYVSATSSKLTSVGSLGLY